MLYLIYVISICSPVNLISSDLSAFWTKSNSDAFRARKAKAMPCCAMAKGPSKALAKPLKAAKPHSSIDQKTCSMLYITLHAWSLQYVIPCCTITHINITLYAFYHLILTSYIFNDVSALSVLHLRGLMLLERFQHQLQGPASQRLAKQLFAALLSQVPQRRGAPGLQLGLRAAPQHLKHRLEVRHAMAQKQRALYITLGALS